MSHISLDWVLKYGLSRAGSKPIRVTIQPKLYFYDFYCIFDLFVSIFLPEMWPLQVQIVGLPNISMCLVSR